MKIISLPTVTYEKISVDVRPLWKRILRLAPEITTFQGKRIISNLQCFVEPEDVPVLRNKALTSILVCGNIPITFKVYGIQVSEPGLLLVPVNHIIGHMPHLTTPVEKCTTLYFYEEKNEN